MSAAARRLDVSVAAVSKQISSLEAEISTQLLERAAAGARPTKLGRTFYQYSRQTLAAAETIKDQLAEERQSISGSLRVSMSRSLSGSSVFSCLADFANNYENIVFDLRFEESLEDLAEADIDFSFRIGRIDDRHSNVAIALGAVRPVLVASRQWRDAGRDKTSSSKESRLRPIFTMPNTLSPAVRKKVLQHPLISSCEKVHVASDSDAVYRTIKAGMGVGVLLDASVADELRRGELVDLTSEDPLPKKPLYLVYSRTRAQLRRHEEFKRHVVNTFKTGRAKRSRA